MYLRYFLFVDSIFNNVTLYKPDITLNEVKQAANEIGIDIYQKAAQG